MEKYTKEELIKRLQKLAQKLSKTPTIKDLREDKTTPSYIVYYNNFGSWNNALKEAKLKINYEYEFYSQKNLLRFLKEFANAKRRSPKTEDFQNNNNLPSPKTYFQRFGSWNNALKEAKLEINIRKDYTNDELLNILKEKAKEIGRSPIGNDMNNDRNMPDRSTYDIHFGSMNHALRLADLEVKYQFRKWTKKQLVEWLQKKYYELGETPGIRDFDKDPEAPAKNTIRKVFGNWTNALREANIPVKRFRSEKELIEIIKKLAKELHRTPTRIDVNKVKGVPSYQPFVAKFGSYTAACLRADLIPNDGRNNKIWQGWQKHCEKMAEVIHTNIEVQKKNLVEGVPDIYVPDKKLFIEAKTCGYKDFKSQIKKYCKNGYNLEFWLIFKGIETKSVKVDYVYAKELADIMKKFGREDLAAKCYQFVKNVFDEGQSDINAY
tara:strand:- start:1517 stop:2824 length:1308 start_codon:yes stop_codon:yes gene_type:complete